MRDTGPRLGHVHFSDSNRCALGTGHIDYTEFAQTLEEMNKRQDKVIEAVTTSAWLGTALIIGVLLLGIIYIFRQVTVLMAEEKWIDSFRFAPISRSDEVH